MFSMLQMETLVKRDAISCHTDKKKKTHDRA